ncbi:SRPBCC family protein [Hydrogenophaga sp. 5NK40-0174]|uniref:SRPBCC family protein n=1 Tax=Hydrogenophaga sp. 5NK40-0174 TaxID=3127649 RepID=UPI00333EC556
MVLALSANVAHAEAVRVKTRVVDEMVQVTMRTTVEAPMPLVWAVLTDYAGSAAWVPGMRSSRILRRDRDGIVVEQNGYIDVVVFTVDMHVVVKVREFPPDKITVNLVEGDFEHLEGAYALWPDAKHPGVTHVQWSGQLKPAFAVPGVVSSSVVERNVRMQFEGLVAEVNRRERARRGLPPLPEDKPVRIPRGGEF